MGIELNNDVMMGSGEVVGGWYGPSEKCHECKLVEECKLFGH
jgi:hypothetical protein